MTPALSVENLQVRYGATTALSEFSFDVSPGELIAIIGPNGAGKTSLIKALCGRVQYGGRVTVGDQVLKSSKGRQKLLGLVPQEIGLYDHLTGRENLNVFAKITGMKGKARKLSVETALTAVGMTEHADRRITHMSGGMQRRINVAAAVMHQPRLIIFDEPTAGVDITARDAVHKLARELSRSENAVLLVTHELEQAEALCDRAIILAGGHCLAYDKPARILSRAFGDTREVTVRFAAPPAAQSVQAMHPFEFKRGELPTIWTAMTEASEVSFVSAFMTALKNRDELVREISVRKPGLPALMRRLEQTGGIL